MIMSNEEKTERLEALASILSSLSEARAESVILDTEAQKSGKLCLSQIEEILESGIN